jgi:hypothetical protein
MLEFTKSKQSKRFLSFHLHILRVASVEKKNPEIWVSKDVVLAGM